MKFDENDPKQESQKNLLSEAQVLEMLEVDHRMLNTLQKEDSLVPTYNKMGERLYHREDVEEYLAIVMAEMEETTPSKLHSLEDSVDLKEFAARVEKDMSTVRRWRKSGAFESYIVDGRYRIPKRELNRVLAERGKGPASSPAAVETQSVTTGVLSGPDQPTYLGYAFGTLRSVRGQIALLEGFFEEFKVTPVLFRDKAIPGMSGIKMNGFKALFNMLRKEKTKLLAICNEDYLDDELLEVIQEICKELHVPLVNLNGEIDREKEERLRSLEERIMK